MSETMALAWRPLVDAPTAARIQAVVDDVATRLRDGPADDDVSLASGACGAAVFFSELHASSNDPSHLDAALSCVDRTLDVSEQLNFSQALRVGLAGVGWAIDHVQARNGGPDRVDTEEVEDALLDALDRPLTGSLGVLDGLCGSAVYLLNRLPRPSAKAGLERLCCHLFEQSERRENDWSTWWVAAGQPAPPKARKFHVGHYDLTAGSGTPGIAAVLSAIARANVAEVVIHRLFDRSLTWLQQQQSRLADGARTLPLFVGPDVAPEARSLGWSESVAATFAVLLPGALAAGREDFVADGLEWVFGEAAGLDAGAGSIGLLSGAAGQGHVYNRLFQRIGDAALQELAVRWLMRTLERLEDRLRDDPGSVDMGLLEGASGAALALLAAVSHREPSWDRVLLLA